MTVPIFIFLLGLIIPGILGFALFQHLADQAAHDKALIIIRTMQSAQLFVDDDLAGGTPNFASGQSNAKLTGSFATRQMMRHYQAFPGDVPYTFRQVAYNPANSADRPDAYEQTLIDTFAQHTQLRQIEGIIPWHGKQCQVVAQPIFVSSDRCLQCHSTPPAAPPDRVRVYGRTGGYGWKRGQLIGANVVYVPTDVLRTQASLAFWIVFKVVGLLCLLCIGLISWQTRELVSRPLLRLLETSQAIRRGDWNARFSVRYPDELGVLSLSFQDTTFWLREQLANEQKLRSMFQQFIPASVAARALGKDPGKVLGGTRHSVTVMIINIRNFKLLMEHLPPDETVNTLNEFFEQVNSVIVANKGLVSKYLGDSVMATFGMPFGNNDHPQRAVRAALQIPRALQKLYVRLEENRGWELGVGIGISTGEPIIGHFGSSIHMEYTVIGDVVRDAHFMEKITKNVPEEDTIVICEATYRAVMSDVHVYDLGEREGPEKKMVHAYVVQGFRSEVRAAIAA